MNTDEDRRRDTDEDGKDVKMFDYFWNVVVRACPCPPLDTEDKMSTQDKDGVGGV